MLVGILIPMWLTSRPCARQQAARRQPPGVPSQERRLSGTPTGHDEQRPANAATAWEPPPQNKRLGTTDSPERPEKMELVSDGTSNTPTVNVSRIITAWTPYNSCSSSRSPGGSVCR